jgi:hypothetical protein
MVVAAGEARARVEDTVLWWAGGDGLILFWIFCCPTVQEVVALLLSAVFADDARRMSLKNEGLGLCVPSKVVVCRVDGVLRGAEEGVVLEAAFCVCSGGGGGKLVPESPIWALLLLSPNATGIDAVVVVVVAPCRSPPLMALFDFPFACSRDSLFAVISQSP